MYPDHDIIPASNPAPVYRVVEPVKVASPRCSCRVASRRITRKYTRREMARLQRRECSRLKQMLPSLAHLPYDVGELVVIEEAIKHISVLEDAILKRIRASSKDPSSNVVEELEEENDSEDSGFVRERSEEDINLLRGLIYPTSFYHNTLFGTQVFEKVDTRPVAATITRKVAPKKC